MEGAGVERVVEKAAQFTSPSSALSAQGVTDKTREGRKAVLVLRHMNKTSTVQLCCS